jgi:hypothetical protein
MRRSRQVAKWSIALVAMVVVVVEARAQSITTSVVADGTLGTVVERSGNTIIVTGGTAVGPNLFHSFSSFDLGRDDPHPT